MTSHEKKIVQSLRISGTKHKSQAGEEGFVLPNTSADLSREKEIKKWRREKKDTLVLNSNPEWKDLSDEW